MDDKTFLNEQKEAQDLFNIDASDHDITSTLRNRINASEKFYDSNPKYKLKTTRKVNGQLLWGEHYEAGKYPVLYRHSVKYEENQIYVAVQTTVAYATSRIPGCEARPWRDTTAGRLLARDYEKFTEAHAVEHDLVGKLTRVIYDLYQKRIGCMKLVADASYKQRGDIVPRHVDPEKIIIDHTSLLDDNPGFIAEKVNDTLANIIKRFPDKRDAILEHCGYKKGTMAQLGSRKDYYEVWITGLDQEGMPEEQLVCFMGGLVLLKTRNPHYAYDVELDEVGNYLPYPPKPYIFMNLLNDGSNKIDQKTVIELVASIQHAINRRKRSIGEQADQFAGLKVWSSDAVDKDDVEDLTGQPGESIVVDAENVNNAVNKVSPDFIPQYMYEDVVDMRNTLHTIFGTPPELRGDNSDTETLGEAIMARDQAEGRMEPLIRAIDAFMNKYYAMLLHFMKIYYTEEHWQAIAGENGTYEYVTMSRDKLADGMDVFVKAGSSLPFDRPRAINTALKLASMQKISTLDLYEMLELDKPQRMYDRWVKETVDPTLLTKEIKEDEGDRTAHMDFEVIKAGKFAPPREDPEPNHITTHRQQIASDEFQKLPLEQQQALMSHVQAEIESLRRRTAVDETTIAATDDAMADPMLDKNDMPDPEDGMMPPGQPGAPGQPPAAPPSAPPAPPAPPSGEAAPTPQNPQPLIQQ